MKILVAEDVPSIRLALKRPLERMGHEVVECEDGKRVLEIHSQGRLPQILILDWLMPGVDGIDVCRQLRSDPNCLPTYIMLLTAKDDKADMLTGMRAGANDYLTKPVRPSELEACIEAAIKAIGIANARSGDGEASASGLGLVRALAAELNEKVRNGQATELEIFRLTAEIDRAAEDAELASRTKKTA